MGGITRIDGESSTSFGVKDGLISRDVWSIAADADELVKLFENSKSDLYKDVFVEALTDERATAKNIKRSLTWIRKSAVKTMFASCSFPDMA